MYSRLLVRVLEGLADREGEGVELAVRDVEGVPEGEGLSDVPRDLDAVGVKEGVLVCTINEERKGASGVRVHRLR